MLISKANNALRWSRGERLDHLFEARTDAFDAAGDPGHLAVIAEDSTLTFRELDNRANRLARFLKSKGLKAGDRIGLLFDKTSETYVALLAVLKINAAYVPLDCGFPSERITFILEDAEVKAILSLSRFAAKLNEFDAESIYIDETANEIARFDAARLSEAEKGVSDDQLAYLIYTSGTTGKPKGVVIEHASICNFVRVAAETYGIEAHDRVYQGMTIAFDFSVEELWVPLLAGATLVPGKPGASLVGEDLADYLDERRVTVLACVPTLLATIERDLPDLRILLVSGEACPHGLVSRWHRPDRVILNAYGPTEATVTATLTELYPNKPVTIGGPLPTYTIVILDEHEACELADGETGEIAIAGIGLAAGYLNRDELTAQKFIPDFLIIPDNPSGRIYRTGDLGRINADGEVEFLGRIDTQVKLRGYRIELTEIESVLLESPDIAQAVVDVWESEPGTKELVAYVSLNKGVNELCHQSVAGLLRGRLPAYMVPSYLEQLPVIPMTVNDKADRKKLPEPKGPRFTVITSNYVAPTNKTEAIVAEELCAVLNIERASIDDHFFQDLGGHSLLMARLCGALRRRLTLGDVSMRDIYLNPTVRKLAAHLTSAAFGAGEDLHYAPKGIHVASNLQYYGCGALQMLYYVGSMMFGIWMMLFGLKWVLASTSIMDIYLRVTAFGTIAFLAFSLLPIAAKWLLIGRWKQEAIPIWSLRYFRFWLVRSLIRSNPFLLFRNLPLFNVYLRLLGAKIGKNVVLRTKAVPVCTDLISIGDNTILRQETIANGYRAQSGYIYTGPVSLGRDVTVGEASYLDIDTAMGDGSQLGHTSSLQAGQRIPAGKRYHGTPAQETNANYACGDVMPCSNLRKVLYTLFAVSFSLFGAIPAVLFMLFMIFRSYFGPVADLQKAAGAFPHLSMEIALYLLPATLILLALGQILSLLSMAVVPRLLNLLIKEDKPYVLYGVHYYIHNFIKGASNSDHFNLLFGDSSYIVHYLRLIGYKLGKIVQTGSNFGTKQRHDNPLHCEIGTGTMVSSGITMINLQMSTTSFRSSKTVIGEENFIGNAILYPHGGRTGNNCLLATKVMVPTDGVVKENVGLLGSPCFEIPRAVDRDIEIAASASKETQARQLQRKNWSNIRSMASLLLLQGLLGYVGLLTAILTINLYAGYGFLAIAGTTIGFTLFAIGYLIFAARVSLGFRRLRPRNCLILDDYFWSIERYWKLSESILSSIFTGTPFRNTINRLLGTRSGNKVFDDGAIITESTLVEIGDYCTLGEGAILQSHSLEEGVFKSDMIHFGCGSSVGAAAFVHYGVETGENSVLAPESFLMKGEATSSNSYWIGNPARPVMSPAVAKPSSIVEQPAEIAA